MEESNKQLLAAALGGDLTAVEKLTRLGADINYKDTWGNFAMFSAAWEGNLEAMDLYYSLGARITHHDANLLCNAAYNGQVTSVRWLLDKNEDVNFTFSDTGENALHYTLSKRSESEARIEIVRILIEAGIDVHKKTIQGKPTLCFMRDAFLKGETPLHRAAAYGSVEIVKMLIAAGADPSVKDVCGDTPLSWGSWHLRDSDLLRLLIYEGVPGIR
jgi:cytohesin